MGSHAQSTLTSSDIERSSSRSLVFLNGWGMYIKHVPVAYNVSAVPAVFLICGFI